MGDKYSKNSLLRPLPHHAKCARWKSRSHSRRATTITEIGRLKNRNRPNFSFPRKRRKSARQIRPGRKNNLRQRAPGLLRIVMAANATQATPTPSTTAKTVAANNYSNRGNEALIDLVTSDVNFRCGNPRRFADRLPPPRPRRHFPASRRRRQREHHRGRRRFIEGCQNVGLPKWR
jgi:hypothetical protein